MALSADDWPRLKEVFASARALTAHQRPAYLAEACAGNDALREEVESLLASDERAKSFLETPAVARGGDTSVTRSLEGQRIGSYQIASRIGAGGMGEVYRARDTTLNRQVAIKVLLPAIADDPDRLARFRREAQVLASLNHPHVAQIHGFEDASGVHALVMELVEGPTLADRIVSGTLPINEALTIASQIADALDAAHEQGIIHRDLKPANIKVREDGVVKVLDFGLAKSPDVQSSAGVDLDVMQSPTLSAHATQAGVILGTAAYMSPEQARGKAVDRRSDLWAFGCVLYEMLTRQRAFGGDTSTDVLEAVVTTEPDWTRLPAETPAAIRTLLRRCLEKNRARRLDSAKAARLEIDDALAEIADVTASETDPSVQDESGHLRRASWSRAAIGAVAITAAALAGVIGGMRLRVEPAVERTAVRFTVEPPAGLTFHDVPALSPDRRHLALVTVDRSRRRQLWLRTMESEVARPIAGTEGASYPFWSPDGQSIGFFADRHLKRVAVAGGPPIIICEAEDGRGGTWNTGGLIVFAPRTNSPLMKVAASGGRPQAASRLDLARETAHRWPHFLPDSNQFLYLADAAPDSVATLRVGSLQNQGSTVLIEGTTEGQYSDGLLFFARRDVLFAQPFDVRRLALGGEPQAIEQGVLQLNSGRFAFSTTPDGALAFLRKTNLNPLTQLTWLNRSGQPIGTVGLPARLEGLAIAPDDRRVAVTRHDENGSDIWMFDLRRGTRTALTNNPSLESRWPSWSRDGRRVAYTASPREDRGGQLYVVSADAPHASTTLTDTIGQNRLGLDWSHDASLFLYRLISADQKSKPGLWLLTLPGVSSVPFRDDGLQYGQATLSPDGRWVAYSSVDSGRLEVHIESFPKSGERVQVSTEGGTQPRWRRDQKELYYLAPDSRLMALSVDVADDVKLGTPAALFTLAVGSPQGDLRGASSIYSPPLYDVAADGRFLAAIVQEEAAAPMPVTVSLTATAVVKRVAPQ